MTNDFLVEIGCEELPPKSLKNLMQAFAAEVAAACDKAELNHGEIQGYATPRRLAVLIRDLAAEQPSRVLERRGPALSAAYDANGKPTKACHGFADSCGVNVKDLSTLDTEKGAWVICKVQQAGQQAIQLMPELIKHALTRLPIRKPMRWGDHSLEFIRPVHWVLMLYGKQVVAATILEQATSDKTYGHRFHHPQAIRIQQPNTYVSQLMATGKVMADFDVRQQTIREQIERLAQQKQFTAIIDPDLLNEVTSLVEWPVALLGQFDPSYLQVPSEVLIAAMRDHQKYFHCVDQHNKLQPYFITICNIESTDPEEVIRGNQRVTNARLADAKFFYASDQQHRLESYLPALASVTFQAKLGSLHDKAERLSSLASTIAKSIAADVAITSRAGLLAKCDLLTQMVGEFPELQGVMGEYYARHDQEPEAVAIAIREHYHPRFAGDSLPQTLPGAALALAERLDTLCGIFAIDQAPTGEKDPFGLRRAAVGVLRLLIEKQFSLDLSNLLQQALAAFQLKVNAETLVMQVQQYILERMRGWYADQGISADIFAAVLERQRNDLFDFDRRVQAVNQFRHLAQAEALAAANKRVSRLLIKEKFSPRENRIDKALLTDPAERDLLQMIETKQQQVMPLFKAAEYAKGLVLLAELQAPIDRFFADVMVMVDDEKQRNNRLALLAAIRELFLQVADLSLLT